MSSCAISKIAGRTAFWFVAAT